MIYTSMLFFVVVTIVTIVIGIYLYKCDEITESLKIFIATKMNTNEYYTNAEQPDQWVVKRPRPRPRPEGQRITWLGHSTFLIQLGKTNILTDPIFGDLSVMYPRKSPLGLPFDQIPSIDVVLLSHNHRDHYDKPSLRLVCNRDDPIILAPWGLHDIEFPRTMVFKWGQRHTCYNDRLSFTFLPAKHWSNRGLFDVNRSLCGSWMITDCHDNQIYFAGDSAYGGHFKTIAEKFNNIQVALLPIGPNEPDHLMRRSHMSTEQAGQAFLDLNARMLIPMHWGTFELGTDTFDSPIKRLEKWWRKHHNPTKCVIPLRFGEQIEPIKVLSR